MEADIQKWVGKGGEWGGRLFWRLNKTRPSRPMMYPRPMTEVLGLDSWGYCPGAGVLGQGSWDGDPGAGILGGVLGGSPRMGVLGQGSQGGGPGAGVLMREFWCRSFGAGVLGQEFWGGSPGVGVLWRKSWGGSPGAIGLLGIQIFLKQLSLL